ncbi:tRNA pseudouridine(13) synthase TruD, partial [Acinetobacter baumannii]
EVTDMADVEQRLEKVKQVGVPNYFGSQRFGNDGNNLDEARRWGRENVRTRNQNKRSMYLSAARSWIFNRIVSARLENGVFDKF